MKGWAYVRCIGLGLAIGLTWAAGVVQAQIPAYQMDRSRTPTFSPYLNLLRGGSSPAINYYGIVRPEITFGNSLYQLGLQQEALQGQQNALGNQQTALAAFTQLPATGHASGFQTQSRYFQNANAQGRGTGFAAGGVGLGIQAPGGGIGVGVLNRR